MTAITHQLAFLPSTSFLAVAPAVPPTPARETVRNQIPSNALRTSARYMARTGRHLRADNCAVGSTLSRKSCSTPKCSACPFQ